MKKTTKAEFNRFKKEFLRWQERLGLHHYRVCFKHEKLEHDYAAVHVDESGCIATVFLTTDIGTGSAAEIGWSGPEWHGKHEAIHLLLWRLGWLGYQRFGCVGKNTLARKPN